MKHTIIDINETIDTAAAPIAAARTAHTATGGARRRIMVTAYADYNFGDDLFLRMLFNRYPRQRFVIFSSPRCLPFFEQFVNVEALDEWTLPRKVMHRVDSLLGRPHLRERVAASADAIVDIGGSRYIEPWFPPQRPDGVKPYFVIGSNYGPASSEEYLRECRERFSRCTDVCLRDQTSYALFADIPQVRHAPDIVFALPVDRAVPKEDVAVLSLIDLNNTEQTRAAIRCHHGEYVASMAALCRDFLRRGVTPVFAAFCTAQGDDVVAREVLSRLDGDERSRVRTVAYDGDMDAIIALFQHARYVVGARFHAVVMGLLCGAEVLPISYSVKTSQMLDDFRQPYVIFDDLPTSIDAAPWARMDDDLHRAVSADADRQFAGLDAFLNA